ncbi:hypothetical protein LTR10_019005 [Elasticomyces elasticus]|uniref:NADPH--hemoprotein reductase n=1 Tax=Exophiala sideris TaxID=1016849 RepID=A0ABR0J317_9EURO|nr:hypothetical protein LTR10_019005 [Elasticomyces elasticus]KAK5026628.1 hypothetical protein LTS07_007562 [Exophiala sideris]KAK5033631.1 hypothetical protein LTR13_006683 [Exophiala sideris]KAK5055454.1 hypothetical protein LTR69_008287 [Exophiala sideris]KAK5176459.1 hypothetical protein LTR44_011020 [Eurotiomycetes sp. CCFEE 6388]
MHVLLQSIFAVKVSAADLDDYDHDYLTRVRRDKALGFVAKKSLDNVRYVIFGLGNSKYRHYNHFVDVVEQTLQDLGATRIGPVGKADASSGNSEEDFAQWKAGIEGELQDALHLSKQRNRTTYQPSIIVHEETRPEAELFLGEPHKSLFDEAEPPQKNPDGTTTPCILPIVDARELIAAGADRICVHLEFDLTQLPVSVKYQTGDHLAVWPINPDSEVNRMMRVLGLEDKQHACVSISSSGDSWSSARVEIPTPTTIDALFRYYLDVCGPVSRAVLAGLAEFVSDSKARARLERLTANPQEFQAQVSQRCLTFAKALQDAAEDNADSAVWHQIPLSYVVENLKRPSQATSVVYHCGVMMDKSGADTFHGLTSNHLFATGRSFNNNSMGVSSLRYSLNGPRNCLAGGRIFARLRRSTFKLPLNPSAPVIMVGTGTGVAPFRGFVQERVISKEHGVAVGKMILVFGFRKRGEDYRYEHDWRQAQQVMGDDRLKLYVAFSRQNPDRKEYVQQCLTQHAGEVF